ncbi:hypothetical protein ILUMI_14786, partial [Ignelater luminosus]
TKSKEANAERGIKTFRILRLEEDAASAELVLRDDDDTNLETDHPEDKNAACLLSDGQFSQDLRGER